MKRWLIPLLGLTLALVAITGAGFALAGNGTDAPEVGAPSGDQPPIRSDEGIDPNECNWLHNIPACEGEPEPGIAVGEPYPMPDPGTPKGPYPMPDDITCGPDQGVAIDSDGQVSCLEPADPQPGDDGQDMVRPGRPPIADAIQ